MKRTLFIFFILLSIGIALAGSLFFLMQHPWVDLSALEYSNATPPTIILDDQGHEIMRFTQDRREDVQWGHLPPHVINAFLAAEDHAFFSHPGISLRGILRSVLVNIWHRHKVQGASTITQQLVKIMFYDAHKTYERKLKEQFLALVIESQFSKEHILQTYLNNIFLGYGIYGIQAASQRFWNKLTSQLTIAQAATLAGIVRAPTRYCPLNAPDETIKRRNVILNSMYQLGFINQQEYSQARTEKLNIQPSPMDEAAHVQEYLRIQLEELVGRQELYTGGLIIQTTLNRELQHQAYTAFQNYLTTFRATYTQHANGGLMMIDTHTGGIKTMIGGYSFKESQFNRALQAKRQIGSLIKPLLYAHALNEGHSLSEVEIDEPITLTLRNGDLWEPHNYDDEFRGPMTLIYALIHSSNIVAVKTLIKSNIDRFIELTHDAGLKGELLPVPSLALGCTDATVWQVTSMFNIFANDGVYIEPYLIEWVKDHAGKKIWKYTPHEHRVLSHTIASQMTNALTLVMDHFKTMYPNNWVSGTAIGKTGTTNDVRTCWFAGSTPDYTTGIYLGRDDNQPLGKKMYASTATLPLWIALHQKIPTTQKNFALDPSLQPIYVNQFTGKQTGAEYEDALRLLVS
jgi:penicillin-binding protein 1A